MANTITADNGSVSGAAGLKSSADSSGVLALQTGSGTTALTLDASQNATFAGTVTTVTGTVYPLVSGTAVASTSGTSIDFTGIPSTAKRITVMFSGVSTSGTSDILIQLGAGSIDATSYVGCRVAFSAANTIGTAASSTGIDVYGPNAASDAFSGVATIALLGSNTWSATGMMGASAPRGTTFGFSKALSGTLDRVRITTVNGTDTFDAGTINIMWE